MASDIPEYFKSFIRVQPDFAILPDRTRLLPAVLEHLVKSERQQAITEEISRLSPRALEERLKLVPLCFEGVEGMDDYLLELFDRYFGEMSPLAGCAPDVKRAAASSIAQAFPYEGQAVFNPSFAFLPEDKGPEAERRRVILTVRSYGEYHRSSIAFRTGWIEPSGDLTLDRPERTEGGATRTYLPRVEGTRFAFPEEAPPGNQVLYGPFMTGLGETWEDVRVTRFTGDGEFGGAYLMTFTAFDF